jgi:hypothetical protein
MDRTNSTIVIKSNEKVGRRIIVDWWKRGTLRTQGEHEWDNHYLVQSYSELPAWCREVCNANGKMACIPSDMVRTVLGRAVLGYKMRK